MQKYLLDIETALLTPRTVFRRMREGEGKAFYKLFQTNNPELKDFFSDLLQETNGEDQSEFWVRKKIAEWLINESYYFSIWEKESAKLIGFIALVDVDWALPKARVRFFVDRHFTQQGIMTEVLNKLVVFSFEQLKMQKLSIRAGMEHIAQQRLARKCGFNREGDLRAELKKSSGEIMDVMLFGLSYTSYEKYELGA